MLVEKQDSQLTADGNFSASTESIFERNWLSFELPLISATRTRLYVLQLETDANWTRFE